jgi:hypothetical protein
LEQLEQWDQRITGSLADAHQERAVVETTLTTAPQVRAKFEQKHPGSIERMQQQNIHVSTICPLMYMNNPLCASRPVATCSNKLRTYTSARFFLEEEILPILVSGDVVKGASHD